MNLIFAAIERFSEGVAAPATPRLRDHDLLGADELSIEFGRIVVLHDQFDRLVEIISQFV